MEYISYWENPETKEELIDSLNKQRLVLEKSILEYLKSLIELDFSVVRKEIDDETREVLSDYLIYRRIAMYNIYNRAINIFRNSGIELIYSGNNYRSKGLKVSLPEKYYGYDLFQSLDEIRPNDNKFYCSCKNSVPQAIIAALDANSYEDAVRGAVSLGGDSDTLACMAGGLAEIRWGVPSDIQKMAVKYMDQNVLATIKRFYQKFQPKGLNITPFRQSYTR